MTVSLLRTISQQLNGTNIILKTEEFQPPVSSIVCNIFWFLALALALSCSLLATFVQQWTRDFIQKTNLRPSPVRRAKSLMSLYFGIRRFGMHLVVDAIPFLLHLSLILFFAGLVLFLIPVNNAIRHLMTCVLVVLVTVYLFFTIIPIVCLDAPFRTPVSTVIWHWVNAIGYRLQRFHDLRTDEDLSLTEAAIERSYSEDEHDKKALEFTIKSLTDDIELLPLIEAIPDAIIGPDGVRSANVSLIAPFMSSSTPLNVISHIANFADNPSAWLDERVGIRCLKAYPRAIWSLAYVAVKDAADSLEWDRYQQQTIDMTRLHFPLSIEKRLLEGLDSQTHSAASALALLRLCQLQTLHAFVAFVVDKTQSGQFRRSALQLGFISDLWRYIGSQAQWISSSPLEQVRSYILAAEADAVGGNDTIVFPEYAEPRGILWPEATLAILGDFLEKSIESEPKDLYKLIETYNCLSQRITIGMEHCALSDDIDRLSVRRSICGPISRFSSIAYTNPSSDILFVYVINQFYWSGDWACSSEPDSVSCRSTIQKCFVHKTFDAVQVWRMDKLHHLERCVLTDLGGEWGSPDKYLPAIWLLFRCCHNLKSIIWSFSFARKVFAAIQTMHPAKFWVTIQHEFYPFIRILANGIVCANLVFALERRRPGVGWSPGPLLQDIRTIGTELLPQRVDVQSLLCLTELSVDQNRSLCHYAYSLLLVSMSNFIAECKKAEQIPPYCFEAFQSICLLPTAVSEDNEIDVTSQIKFAEGFADLVSQYSNDSRGALMSRMLTCILNFSWRFDWLNSRSAADTLVKAIDQHDELYIKYSVNERDRLHAVYARCKEILEPERAKRGLSAENDLLSTDQREFSNEQSC